MPWSVPFCQDPNPEFPIKVPENVAPEEVVPKVAEKLPLLVTVPIPVISPIELEYMLPLKIPLEEMFPDHIPESFPVNVPYQDPAKGDVDIGVSFSFLQAAKRSEKQKRINIFFIV